MGRAEAAAVHITVSTDGAIRQYASRLEHFVANCRRGLAEAVNEAGDLERTQVRRDLKEQTGVKAYRSIVSRTGSKRATAGSLVYTIEGRGKGMPIKEFPVRAAVHSPVNASPWGVSHTFERSFTTSAQGLLRARLGPDRMPIRALYGPAVSKEIIKDQTASHFESTAASTLDRIVLKRLARLVP